MTKVEIDSTAIKSAAREIQNSIKELKDTAKSIDDTLNEHREAYGDGDVDAAEMKRSVETIGSTLSENADKIEANIQLLRQFADAMERVALKG